MSELTAPPMEGPVEDAALARLSTAPAPPQPDRRGSRLGPLRTAWRQLTSMRTALILLFLLALAAVPGTLLPQRGLNPLNVTKFYKAHPALAPVLDRLSLFDVFAAPWFAAIYLLLFISLVGCLVPRCRLHLRALRARPPAAPRQLSRLRCSARYEVDTGAAEQVAAAARLLRGRRFRVDVREEPGGAASLGAEKGYLRETGNLLFHLSLVALLVGIALGGLFGYKGTALIVEGDGFSNTVASYDTFNPGRLFSAGSLSPFSFTLTRFRASYQPNGVAKSFDADVSYHKAPGAPARSDDVRVNHPLVVGGTKVYLVGHGYAPVFVVRDPAGTVVYDRATPFLPQDNEFTSIGVVKAPDAAPAQLGFDGFFFPTAAPGPGGVPRSTFPGARAPLVALRAWRGDLGLDSGTPQSVYSLDTSRLTKEAQGDLAPGQTMRLPGGGSITFAGLSQWGTFQVTHDPGKLPALGAAAAIVVGLVLSLRIRRRRVWVRAAPTGGTDRPGRTVVEVAGLARTDADDFADEFADLLGRLRPSGARVRPDDEE